MEPEIAAEDETFTLVRTYFLSKEEDIYLSYWRYFERVERVKQYAEVYMTSDVEYPESEGKVRDSLLVDLRRQSDVALVEDEWNLYSYSTALTMTGDPAAAQTRIREDLLLADEEELPKSFISKVLFSFIRQPE